MLLVGSKEGHPACKNWVVGCWCGYLSGARCIWPSWCHCHSLSLASVKSRFVLPFWYRLTRVVPEKGPLNGCVCCCHHPAVNGLMVLYSNVESDFMFCVVLCKWCRHITSSLSVRWKCVRCCWPQHWLSADHCKARSLRCLPAGWVGTSLHYGWGC